MNFNIQRVCRRVRICNGVSVSRSCISWSLWEFPRWLLKLYLQSESATSASQHHDSSKPSIAHFFSWNVILAGIWNKYSNSKTVGAIFISAAWGFLACRKTQKPVHGKWMKLWFIVSNFSNAMVVKHISYSCTVDLCGFCKKMWLGESNCSVKDAGGVNWNICYKNTLFLQFYYQQNEQNCNYNLYPQKQWKSVVKIVLNIDVILF